MWTNYWIIRPELPDNKDTDFNLNGEISGLPLSLSHNLNLLSPTNIITALNSRHSE